MRPHLRISLFHNGSLVFQKQKCATFRESVLLVLKGRQMLEYIAIEEDDFAVDMFIPKLNGLSPSQVSCSSLNVL